MQTIFLKHPLMLKMLFIDDRYISRMEGVKRNFLSPVKESSNPVICADRPWERDAAFVDSGLVIFDAVENKFKAWYQGGACYGPGDGSNMCYAVSNDGILWHKPNLGMIEFEGSKQNNIVLMAECMMHDPAVIVDDKEDSNRRYKAVWWGGKKDQREKSGWLIGRSVGFSPDGIHWSEHPGNPVWEGDAEVTMPFGLYRESGNFVAYTSADGYGMRVIARTESPDFLNWYKPPKLCFISDEQDVPGTEMAGLAAVDYDGIYIGMLWVIRNLPEFTKQQWREICSRNIEQGFFGWPIEMNNTRCRIMYSELVTSLDGVNWNRLNRQPYIPLGEIGAWDESILLAGRPFVAKDKIYIYYTGHGRVKKTPGLDNERIGNWNVDTGLATLRLDGFASLDATGQGWIKTKDFILTGPHITINADASGGEIRAEILDCQNHRIEGFTLEESLPVYGDNLGTELRWKKHPAMTSLLSQRITLKLTLSNASLYSISIREE